MPKQTSLDEASRAAREFGDAAEAVRLAAAAHLGVNRSDLRILAALHVDGPASAGAMAAAAELSPAATTEAVQRLAARGLVRRDTDPADRRRAVIGIEPAAARQLDTLFGPVRTGGRRIGQTFTDAELAVVVRFLDLGRDLQLAAAERIRAGG
ncbi:MarR family winged helix-turn-helix transcriptional regulator [Pseudonocardia sp.]|uniref:MarR family winged helix-turn-helix transcriptional regulator n=1 Tax=Pseudonocardia sp. TaxID=60912 RepID=UPI003D0B4CCA